MRTGDEQRILESRVVNREHQPVGSAASSSWHTGHGWMMIVCCIPMVVISIVLVATGVAGPGFLLAAVGCTLMMALMMRGMGHGGDRRS